MGLRVHDLWHTAATWRLVGCECQDGSVDAGLRVDSDDVGRLRRALTDDIDAVVELLTRPFLWLVRTHCGLRMFCDLLRVLT